MICVRECFCVRVGFVFTIHEFTTKLENLHLGRCIDFWFSSPAWKELGTNGFGKVGTRFHRQPTIDPKFLTGRHLGRCKHPRNHLPQASACSRNGGRSWKGFPRRLHHVGRRLLNAALASGCRWTALLKAMNHLVYHVVAAAERPMIPDWQHHWVVTTSTP